ncbi:MAG: hypothetical protein OEW84_04145 [Aigarchaeota archaeon]|nr:hypothetical protein [Aigarchaeota archaeon]
MLVDVALSVRTGYSGALLMFILALIIVGIGIYLTINGVIKPRIRRLPGIDALDECIGRATELGRPVHFTVGIGGISNVQVIAGLSIAGYVARKCAELGVRFLFTFSQPTVQPAAMDLIKEAYVAAGKPEDFVQENVMWLSGRQFSFATGVMGLVVRERVAANLILGYFAAESLIFAEAGFRAGAVQIAGTTNSYQIPFFVATCDYTLISEELITAGAYISQEPGQVGSVLGQDYIRVIGLVLMAIGSILYAVGFKTLTTWLGL